MKMVTHTFAKYLQIFSAAAPRSWLKGQADPAWQAPWRKNLHGTCAVSVGAEERSESAWCSVGFAEECWQTTASVYGTAS